MAAPAGERGIHYGYGDKDVTTAYHLGEQPVSGFLDTVYAHLQDLPQGAVVVDLGCGAGRFPANAPEDRPWNVFGVDLDPNAVAQAQTVIGEGDKVVVGDITKLDEFGLNGDVKAAVSHRVLHALPEGLQVPVLGSAAEVLPPGGDLFISAAAATDWKADALREKGIDPVIGSHDVSGIMFRDRGVPRTRPFTMSFFTPDRIAEMADRAGLHVVSEGSFTENSGYDHLKGEVNTYVAAQLRKPSRRPANGRGAAPRLAAFTPVSQ